jgi:L-seryl-tRNA(Ser) seleniumtransferase
MRRDPLARAMRPDKVTLAAVAATLGLYRAGLALERIPVWRMIAIPTEELRVRATAIAALVNATEGATATTVDVRSTVGGGSLPGETLASVGVAIKAAAGSPDRLLGALRTGTPAVVARIEDGRVVLDLRTVVPAADPTVVEAIRAAVAYLGGSGRPHRTHASSRS